MTFHYKWKEPSGTAPANAVAHVTSNANWHNGGSGSAANGLDSAYVYTPPSPGQTSAGGVSSGDAYELKNVAADGTFDVTLSPSVITNGVASVSVSVDVTPVVLSVAGTKPDTNGNLLTLIGRQQTGSISAGSYPIDPASYSWSVSGPQLFDHVGSQLHTYEPVVGAHTASNVSFYASKDGSETVSCTCDVLRPDNGVKIGSVTATSTITAERSTYSRSRARTRATPAATRPQAWSHQGYRPSCQRVGWSSTTQSPIRRTFRTMLARRPSANWSMRTASLIPVTTS